MRAHPIMAVMHQGWRDEEGKQPSPPHPAHQLPQNQIKQQKPYSLTSYCTVALLRYLPIVSVFKTAFLIFIFIFKLSWGHSARILHSSSETCCVKHDLFQVMPCVTVLWKQMQLEVWWRTVSISCLLAENHNEDKQICSTPTWLFFFIHLN